MYAYENDRREYGRGHDDDRVSVNVHANEHVHVYVRAHGGGDVHVHGRDGDDQSHQRCHDLFRRVPYAHRSLFPKYCFSRCGLHEDDNRRGKWS